MLLDCARLVKGEAACPDYGLLNNPVRSFPEQPGRCRMRIWNAGAVGCS